MQPIKPRTVLALSLLLVLSTATAVIAGYEITSNHVTVTVSNPLATLTLTASATEFTSGQSVTLTATLSDFGNNILISLYEGGTMLEQKPSAGGGIATFTVTPSVGTHDYVAYASHP